MRLAIVSPLPEAPTGIADYTMDVVRSLGSSHEIELFHDQARVSPALGTPAFPIHEMKTRGAFDAIVYQMGNAPLHDFMYDWMEKVPGIVVLHDLVLHAFTRRFLDSPESRAYAADPSSAAKQAAAEGAHTAYRDLIETLHPGQGERLKDAHLNSSGDLLSYAFPLFEPALLHARAVGVHNSFMAEAIKEARPDLPCVKVAMPVRALPVDEAAAKALRARLGFREEDAIVGCFGLVTREKRMESVARAVARVAEIRPNVRLLLAGPVADAPWLKALLDRLGVSGRTLVTGRLDIDDFVAAMALTDAVVHLRYPTARETSAALLRVMAQGRPVIIEDIANQSEIPRDVARRVDPCDEEGDLTRSLDWILRNPGAARAMGERAAEYVRVEHSEARTRESYDRLLASAPQ